jgi:hypothetical protein
VGAEDLMKPGDVLMQPVLLLLFVACMTLSAGTAEAMSTIEEAEKFIASKGFQLSQKEQDSKTIVGDRVFKYTIQGINLSILQFNSSKAMNAWANMVRDFPLGGSRVIRKGQIAIQVWPGEDATRQMILERLDK